MLAPKLRGWVIYFRYAGVKGIFEELDGWIRRHLRKILWRQWKRPGTRAKWLMRLGLSEVRACTERFQRAWPVVELGCFAPESGFTEKVL